MSNQANNPLKFIFIIVLVMAGFLFWRNSSGGGKDSIPWRTDLREASQEARQQGKPMVVYFTADWCPPCRQMKKDTWTDADVAKSLSAYVPVKLDVDKNPDAARKYNVRGIPHVQIMNADGEVGPSRVGFVSADEMVGWLGKE